MANLIGTAGNDIWSFTGGLTATIDGLGGIDTVIMGLATQGSFEYNQSADGAIHVDTISGASDQAHLTLYNVEKLVFSNGTVTMDLTKFFDLVAPTVTGFDPATSAVNVPTDKDILINFSEAIAKGSGTIVITTAAGAPVATYDIATSPNVSVSGNSLKIDPSADLSLGTTYNVTINSGAVKDLAGNSLAAGSTLSFSTVNNTTIVGTSGNDNLKGGGGDDKITGGGGNDIINGGDGTDTAIYSGKLSDYNISGNANSLTVQDKVAARDGSDSLSQVERLQFSDHILNLSVQADARSISSGQLHAIEELYVAFFNRVPDADGLDYWIHQYKAGLSISQIGNSFFSAAQQFPVQTGFSSSQTDTDFITLVYKNVLGRNDGPDADGLSYWLHELGNGTSHGSLVSTILNAAHTYKGDPSLGWVADLLDNKIAVADQVAVAWGLNFLTPEAAITGGMAIAAAITPTDTSAAIKLVGIDDSQIKLG
ncbi:Ig-like domain-containing protein [Undibacterium terreum]|uniref:DUF4214 domain-containing protein n=1 Tax=Undibacterium terreum TaxID=1224302 RepID=A0A916XQI4_9BURK|nr:Ig-like domain-containing protein [Undibacterium terreum]GGC96711.1 hypothetical protein GCM10011396_50180 [Undibacterium terreum]